MMQVNRRHMFGLGLRAIVLVPLAVQLMGCHAQPAQWPELGRDGSPSRTTRDTRPAASNAAMSVQPVTSSEVADLSADDVIKIAMKIGFTKQQIVQFGADLRDALHQSGAARVLIRGNVEALLRVQSGNVWISSATYGDHVYSLSTGQFRFE